MSVDESESFCPYLPRRDLVQMGNIVAGIKINGNAACEDNISVWRDQKGLSRILFSTHFIKSDVAPENRRKK